MSSSPFAEPGLLQLRLQEKKNNSKSHPQPDPDSVSGAVVTGRDDGIFDLADSPQAPRRSSARLYQSSPMNPSFQRITQSRRTSGLGSSPATSQRTMGARETEDQLDKLQKQNFDLKLEVYHRREKIEELEKKLKDFAQMKEDNEELVILTTDLTHELDKRDQAVDEAVVMICELEDKLRLANEQLEEARPRTARPPTPEPKIHRSTSYQTMSTPARQRRRTNSLDNAHTLSRGAVSPEVSRQMLDLATSPKGKRARRLPGFMTQESQTTRALTSLFVEGHKQIRPVPSRETFLSGTEADSIMRSPAMSVLSESEFKSLYGEKDASPERPRTVEVDSGRISPAYSTRKTERARLARTNKWVNERATSPVLYNPKPTRHSGSSHFQSLGGVLQDETGKPYHYSTDGTVPPVAVYGRNNFPPTPDTMRTQPSDKSSASLVPERRSSHSKRISRAAATSSIAGDLHAPAPFLPKRSILPVELQGYPSDSDDDDSWSSLQRPLPKAQESRPTAADSSRRAVTYQNYIMPGNLFEMNRKRMMQRGFSDHSSGFDAGSGDASDQPSFDRAPPPPAHKFRVSSGPLGARPRPLSNYETVSNSIDLGQLPGAVEDVPPPLPLKDLPPPPPPHKDDVTASKTQLVDEHGDLKAQTGDGAGPGMDLPPSRTDLIRQRVAKFGRRSAPTSQDNTPRHARDSSFGRRTKQFFRRNSNTQKRPTTPRSPTSPQRRRRSSEVVDREDHVAADAERRLAFMNAAQAAAPFLDIMGNQRRDPAVGKYSVIPSMAHETRGLVSSGSSSTPTTPVEGGGPRSHRNSIVKLFPRRGKDGEDVEPSSK